MSHEITGDGSWYILTNGTTIFHAAHLPVGNTCGHNQTHVLKDTTEDLVYAKCFVTPARDAEGEYDIDTLTPKSEAAIIAAAEGE